MFNLKDYFKKKHKKKIKEMLREERRQRNEREERIIRVLESVDIRSSPIPDDQKYHSSLANQSCSDLELVVIHLPKYIRIKEAFYGDTTELDRLLLDIACKFKCAVQVGDTQAAFTAKAGLIKGIHEFRHRLPYIRDKKMAEQFIKMICDLLKEWIVQINTASYIDQYTASLKQLQDRTDNLKYELKKANDLIDFWLNDPNYSEYAEALNLWNDDHERTLLFLHGSANLTPIQIAVRDHMLQKEDLESKYSFASYYTDEVKERLRAKKKEYDELFTKMMSGIIDT